MSANLLDSIVESQGPRVIAENHDLGSINWVNGLSDPGEMLACGYLPEARRQEGESDADYATRLLSTLPPDLINRIRTAAIKRAGYDTSNGRVNLMVVVGPDGSEMPWARLGVMVAQAVNASQAIALAGLGWKVLKVPAEREWAGKRVVSDNTFLLVRDDTGAELGSVGKLYQPIQNEDGFSFLDDVLRDYDARYETAGSVYGGKKVWCQARLPKPVEPVKGDVVEGYATFTLSKDGTEADKCFPTTLRAVCANTLRLATSDGRGKGISIRHTGDVKAKIDDARQALGLSVKRFADFGEKATAMARVQADPMEYAAEVLDAVLDVTDAQARMGADILAAAMAKTDAQRESLVKVYQKAIVKREKLLDDILTRYESPRCQKGTVWGAYNAVSEAADHGNWHRYQGENKDSRRFESVLVGDADDLKQVAWQTAVKAVSN